MADITLLPCPFCGSNDIDPEGWATSGGIAGPCCNGCQASIGSALHSTAKNIALWNVRSGAAPEMLAALKLFIHATDGIADYSLLPPERDACAAAIAAIAKAEGTT